MSFEPSTPIALSECVFATGLATTESEYRAAVDHGEFERRWLTWPTYDNAFPRYFRTAIAPLSAHGLRVESFLTPERVTDLFRAPTKVVILLTHWNGESMQLGGRMQPPDRFISRVPESFCGLVDLASCDNEDVCSLLKARIPSSRIVFRTTPIRASAWLLFLGYVLATLLSGRTSYMECLARALKAFRFDPALPQ